MLLCSLLQRCLRRSRTLCADFNACRRAPSLGAEGKNSQHRCVLSLLPRLCAPLQASEMSTQYQSARQGDSAGTRNRRRELFREEDVKLQWSTVRKAVSLCLLYMAWKGHYWQVHAWACSLQACCCLLESLRLISCMQILSGRHIYLMPSGLHSLATHDARLHCHALHTS